LIVIELVASGLVQITNQTPRLIPEAVTGFEYLLTIQSKASLSVKEFPLDLRVFDIIFCVMNEDRSDEGFPFL